ncbi:MAG: hypothetical protein NT023_17365 [Armatimonadetes bacterium]|nr:hypothetical protein [Armatimonadota bacterium]
MPSAVHMEGRKRHRALVTIEIFQLDSREERANLFRDRALIITHLFIQLENKANAYTEEGRQIAQERIESLTSPVIQHANCARSFRDLYYLDRAKAKAYENEAWDYINGKS